MCWTDIFPNPDSDFDGGVASKKWYDENDIDITGESYRMETDPKALCKVDINRRVFQHLPYAGAPCYDTVQCTCKGNRTDWYMETYPRDSPHFQRCMYWNGKKSLVYPEKLYIGEMYRHKCHGEGYTRWRKTGEVWYSNRHLKAKKDKKGQNGLLFGGRPFNFDGTFVDDLMRKGTVYFKNGNFIENVTFDKKGTNPKDEYGVHIRDDTHKPVKPAAGGGAEKKSVGAFAAKSPRAAQGGSSSSGKAGATSGKQAAKSSGGTVKEREDKAKAMKKEEERREAEMKNKQEREERKRARDAGGGGGGGGGGEEEGGRGSRRRTGGGKVLDTGRSRAPEAAAAAKSGNVPNKGEDVPPAKQAPVRNETSVSRKFQPLESKLPLEEKFPNGKTERQLAKMSFEEVAIWLAMPGLDMPQNVLDTVRMGGVNGVQIFDMTLEELTEDLGMDINQAKRLCLNRLPIS